MNLTELESEKKRLLNIFQTLKDSPFVPLNSPTFEVREETINEWIRKVEKEEFIVSVCGQVKAGKSTFLNLLIFENEVLPTASTPETAKLTILRYREQPLIRVHFYSEEDLNRLKNYYPEELQHTGRSYYEKYIAKPLKEKIKMGKIPLDFEKEVISEKVREIFPQNPEGLRNQLQDFVGAEGLLTPLVKHVELFYPSPLLQKITVVDTPGLNDPNPARSEETKRWMSRSDAVIYLIYAGQPFHREDKTFFEEFLAGNVHPSRVIVVLSKADLCENLKEIENYVRNSFRTQLGENGEEFFREVPIFPISAYITLVKHRKEKLGEDHPDVARKLEELERRADDLAVERSWKEGDKWLEALRQAIEKKLCEVKGWDILESAYSKIEAFEKEWLKKFAEEENRLRHELETVNKGFSAIQEEYERLCILADEKDEIMKIFTKEQLPKHINDFKSQIDLFIDKKFVEIKERVFREALTDKKVNVVKAKMIVKDYEKKLPDELFNEIKRLFKKHMKEVLEEFKEWLLKDDDFLKNFLEILIKIQENFFYIPSDKIREKVREEFVEKLYEIKKVKKLLFIDNPQGTREKFEKALEVTEDGIKGDIKSTIENELEQRIKNIQKPVFGSINEQIKSLKAKMNDVKEKLKTDQQIIQEIKEKLNNIQKTRQEFESFMNRIKV